MNYTENTDLFEILENDICQFNSEGKVYVFGDFNGRVGEKLDFVTCDKNLENIDLEENIPDRPLARASLDKTCNNQGKRVLELCKSNQLRIANGRLGNVLNTSTFTFMNSQTATTIDYLLLCERDFNTVSKFCICDFNYLSDHAPLDFTISCFNPVVRDYNDNFYSFTKTQWNDSLRDEFRHKLISRLPDLNRAVYCLKNPCKESIDECLNAIVSILHDEADPLFSKKVKIKSNACLNKNESWFDEECFIAKTNYRSMRKIYNSCRSEENRSMFFHAKRKYKKMLKRKKKEYKLKQVNKITLLRHSKPKDFWNLFTSKKNSSCQVPLTELFEHFQCMGSNSVLQKDKNDDNYCTQGVFQSTDSTFEELNVCISQDEITKVIKKLKLGKAPGSDELLNSYFTETFDIILPYLCDLFNAILDSGSYPSTWAEGIVIPIFKKGDPNIFSNYRGITLLSNFSKIFTGVLQNRISKWSDENNIISDAQFGFREKMSTVDATFVLNSVIHKFISEKKRLYCAFIDFKRVFDSINRNLLWFKLNKLGLNGKILRIIQDMYSKIKAKVRKDNLCSDFFDNNVGLLQGEKMSPILFSLFLEDLELYLQGVEGDGIEIFDMIITLLLFADDIVILAKSPSELQNKLNKLKDYCELYDLKVNCEKTKIVVFRKRGKIKENEKWWYGGKSIEIVDKFNYLGTVFYYTGNFSNNFEFIQGKALRALNVFMFKIKDYELSPDITIELFDSFVGSILNYGSEVWGFSKANQLERVHLKFLKRLLYVK